MIDHESRPDQIVALRFTYHEVERVVDAVTFRQHRESAVVCGYEVFRDREPSLAVKRYRLGELRDVSLLDAVELRRLREELGEPRPG